MPTNAAATGFWSAMPGGSRANNARQGRALLQGVYQNNDATPMNGTRSGVLVTTGLTVASDLLVQVTSGLTMSVAPGTGAAHRSGQGPYEGWLLASASVTTDPAPATNPRNDLVVMRWYDSALGDVSPDGNPCRIEIIPGTPGAIPADPISVNSLGVYTSFPTTGGGVGIPLARAQVSTGGAITLTDIRRSTGLVGGSRFLLPGDSDTAGRAGDYRYNPATDVFEAKRNDGNWYPVKIGPDTYLEVRASGTQSMAVGANKLTFGTTVRNSGITWSSSNTATIPSDGRYAIYASSAVGFNAANNFGVGVHGTTAPAAGNAWYSGTTFASGQTDAFTSNTRWFTAGTQICAYLYNNNSTITSLNPAVKPAEFIIHKVP